MLNPPNFNKISIFIKASHELKNPIHGIKGIANYLYNNWTNIDDNTKKTCVANIFEAAKMLQNLSDRLLSLVSVSDEVTYIYDKANIVEIAQSAIDTINLFVVGKNPVNVFLECQEQEVYANLDSFWIGQVLFNLIDNALKHSEAKNIKIKIDSDKQNLVISVIDDGIGIPKEELDSIFAPFKQSSITKTASKGSGLGLSICTEVVKAHNGRISAENNKEGGASMIFTLSKNIS